MAFDRAHGKEFCGSAALLVAGLIISGCAGIKPYEPRDNREEGPAKGLFTGPAGEFVILRKPDESKIGSENKKNADERERVVHPEAADGQIENADRPKR